MASRPTRGRLARPSCSICIPPAGKPSKPPGCGTRRCRRTRIAFGVCVRSACSGLCSGEDAEPCVAGSAISLVCAALREGAESLVNRGGRIGTGDLRPPSRAAIGVDASLGVPRVPIVPGRGRSGRIGHSSRYQGGTTSDINEPHGSERCPLRSPAVTHELSSGCGVQHDFCFSRKQKGSSTSAAGGFGSACLVSRGPYGQVLVTASPVR